MPAPSAPRISRSAMLPSSAASLNCPSASRARPGLDVPRGADHRRAMRRHRRWPRPAPPARARAPAGTPATPLVELLHQQRRRDRERAREQRLGLPHPADVLIRRRQQIEVVLVVPIMLDRNLLRREVGRFERVGRRELRDRLVDPACAPRGCGRPCAARGDGRRHLRICRALRQRLLHPAAVLVGVGQVVMRRRSAPGASASAFS